VRVGYCQFGNVARGGIWSIEGVARHPARAL